MLTSALLVAASQLMAAADRADPTNRTKPPVDSPMDDPGYEWELTPAQAALADRISRLESSVDPSVLEAGPPSFQYGVLGTTGNPIDGYTIYLDSTTTAAELTSTVFSGLAVDSLKSIRFAKTRFSIEDASATWKHVGARKWLSSPTNATYIQDFDPVLGMVVVTVGSGTTQTEIDNLRSQVPTGLAIRERDGSPQRLPR